MKADAAAGGDGSRSRPFATLEQVEAASQPGDTIRVVPSMRPLDGGIQLKDGQRLTGLGDPVTRATASGARPTITNTSATRYNGDAVRLANNNLVENIHVDGASRSGIFGVNAARPEIRGTLITNNMIQETICDAWSGSGRTGSSSTSRRESLRWHYAAGVRSRRVELLRDACARTSGGGERRRRLSSRAT